MDIDEMSEERAVDGVGQQREDGNVTGAPWGGDAHGDGERGYNGDCSGAGYGRHGYGYSGSHGTVYEYIRF